MHDNAGVMQGCRARMLDRGQVARMQRVGHRGCDTEAVDRMQDEGE